MKRTIFSAATILILSMLVQNAAWATGSNWNHRHSGPPRVHNLADILKSGEIIGQVSFCGPEGTNGSHVDLVGESFQAVLGAGGEFKLRYVPRGAYTLRVRIPGQPEHTRAVRVKKRKITDVGEIALCPDNDDDGFALDVDCNDNNADIFPGAEEVCDGVDNNCDGEVDGAGCNCTDNDNDGFFAQEGCGTAVDCNDLNDLIKPGASEICDGIDNNCDNTIDEGFDLNTDLNNCGACSNVCSGSCQGGVCFSVCGNGVVEDGEECDDGNTTDGDGCQADCTLPVTCSDGTPAGDSRPCDGPDTDQCVNGIQTCNSDGQFGECVETVTDIVEICNGIDDDCDGDTDEGACSGTGAFSIKPAATYTCSFGLFDLNVQNFSFQDIGGSSIQVTGTPSGPVMIGNIDPTGSFQASVVIPGGVNEDFRLSGQFSDPDNWTGTFSVSFFGDQLPLTNCVNQSWSITGAR